MDINKRLSELYSSKWDDLYQAFYLICADEALVTKPTNPLLIKIRDEEDFASADIRLMIFGQETNGWYEKEDTVEGVMDGYDGFFSSEYCYSYGGQFWNGVKKFVSMLSVKYPEKKVRYLKAKNGMLQEQRSKTIAQGFRRGIWDVQKSSADDFPHPVEKEMNTSAKKGLPTRHLSIFAPCGEKTQINKINAFYEKQTAHAVLYFFSDDAHLGRFGGASGERDIHR